MSIEFWRWSVILGFGALASGCGNLDVPDPEAARRDNEPIFDLPAVERNHRSAQIAARAQDEPKILIFNRPFVLLLREARSGALLFAGIVNDPQVSP